MDKLQYESIYWSQYLLLEKEFVDSLVYVELDAANYNIFSKVYLKLLLEIGSEVDNVMREMIAATGRTGIDAYALDILQRYPQITTQIVLAEGYNLQFKPFDGWNTQQPSQSLQFWQVYNDVKHDRVTNYHEASLENVLDSLAGLFILLMYRMNELYTANANENNNYPMEESGLFVMSTWTQHIRSSRIQPSHPLTDDDERLF